MRKDSHENAQLMFARFLWLTGNILTQIMYFLPNNTEKNQDSKQLNNDSRNTRATWIYFDYERKNTNFIGGLHNTLVYKTELLYQEVVGDNHMKRFKQIIEPILAKRICSHAGHVSREACAFG